MTDRERHVMTPRIVILRRPIVFQPTCQLRWKAICRGFVVEKDITAILNTV